MPAFVRPIVLIAVALFLSFGQIVSAQTSANRTDEIRELRRELASINERLTRLEKEETASAAMPDASAASLRDAAMELRPPAAHEISQPAEPAAQTLTTADRAVLDTFHGTTFNMLLDGYYGYNFNNPIGRANLLRVYDTSSNAFSLSQADFIFEHAPDPASGKRFGARMDLQFGQATETIATSANEPRPDTYRNIFQAYGTYIVPVGSGLTVDFGKWASSLGAEGTYSKDQINYSRSYWFGSMPFYHAGIRTSYAFTPRLAAHYWVVNGTQQTEPFNNFKDQMFGFEAKPTHSIDWTVNYYLGQEHPDFAYVPNGPSTLPTQQGVPFEPIVNAPKGKLHIVDTYATWTATPKLTFVLEGDYVINRNQTYSAPQHATGGAVYARYQFNPMLALGSRAEYFSDRGGLYSGKTQALKEFTVTFDQTLLNGFLMREELRHDFSNQPYFLTDTLGNLSNDQTTATVGLIWWFGGKQGTW